MKKILAIAALLILLVSKTSFVVAAEPEKDADEIAADEMENNDPIEPVNRAIFNFNSVADKYILRPVAIGYRDIVPQWGRQRVTNVLYNLSEPVTVLNSTLQGNPENAFTSAWRFIFNSTIGIVGVFDVATDLGLKARKEDFGQTLGMWGYRDSTYIVIPLLGPSTLRDLGGLGVDYVTNPFYNGMVFDDTATTIGLAVAGGVDKRTNLLPITDDIDITALDPYTAYRSSYIQLRQNRIDNGGNEKAMPVNY